jgi:hypothetical protein
MTELQCDHAMCTEEASVYAMCVEHAPKSWLREALNEDPPILDAEQREEARERLETEEESSA